MNGMTTNKLKALATKLRALAQQASVAGKAKLRSVIEKALPYLETLEQKPWVVAVKTWLEGQLQKLDTKRDFSLDFLSDADRIEAEPISKGAPITLYAIIYLLGFCFLWAAFAELDKVVSAPGRLMSTEPNIILQAPDTAEITKFNAMVGKRVKAGEVLLTLDPTVAEADRKQIEERFGVLTAQLKRLEVEQRGGVLPTPTNDDERAQYDVWRQRNEGDRARLAQFGENIARLKDSVVFAQSEVRLLESRLKSQQDLEAMNKELVEKKFQSRKALIDSTDRRLEIEQQLALGRNRLNEHQRNLKALESERQSYLSDRRQKILEEQLAVKQEHDTLNQQLIKASRKAEQINLVAPIDAIVLEVAKLSVGSIARLAEPLITLVPTNAEMLAEVSITTSEISGVREGQEVRVKISAYPFQRYGYLMGKVDALSPDSVTPEGSASQERVYIGRVKISEWNFNGSETPGAVLPGMTLTAEIITGQRSILSYLLEPIIKTKDEALNER
jgi:hemolysin D